jgi:hypothetical protein
MLTSLCSVLARACLCLLLVQAVAACAVETYEEPATVGWTCLPTYGGCGGYGMPQTVAHATVGLPFEWTVLAGCNTGDGWYYSGTLIDTGRLPPGLEFSLPTTNVPLGGEQIVGVPTRGGSFSFQVVHKDINCSGASYLAFGDLTAQYTIEVRGN